MISRRAFLALAFVLATAANHAAIAQAPKPPGKVFAKNIVGTWFGYLPGPAHFFCLELNLDGNGYLVEIGDRIADLDPKLYHVKNWSVDVDRLNIPLIPDDGVEFHLSGRATTQKLYLQLEGTRWGNYALVMYRDAAYRRSADAATEVIRNVRNRITKP